ncbi:hypothetical protein Emtol_0610 [Emticicia oligotrophica DSM 17448]|uniref:DinB-like domain-containing protein n=1 Tax=Emticicia oligotrophica (strain DSM 17448 / CIP 109782 / MTCC 6937 / GPTSA100-15) TaxID=929562 RepID=A0ABM5MXE2_EMTOG|nr:DinB family protein [Emticicia oligotrophica]AFK01763.1 hypothetical protein Emtol_0610 [Emticicia oligotrophica DSM 17448]
MSPTEVYSNLETIIQQYIDSLEQYSDEQFFFKKDEDTWSLGQMYEHLTASSQFFFLANCIRCLEKRKGQEGGEKNQFGEKLFKYGGFPPVKLKIPEPIRGPEPIAKPKADYKPILEKILSDSKALIETVSKDEGEYKALQVAMGWLNAQEWYFLHEMHYRHHLRQKTELENINA